MWILECDGEILEHKRLWLRPGNTYLFGRTSEQKGRKTGFFIDEKSVSRKHVTLSISAVKRGEGSRVHARSEITLRDENTKFGTEVDGEKLNGAEKVLKLDEHAFKLGKTTTVWKVKWQPVVLSFSLSSKELKGGKDPLVAVRSRVEDLDIKAVVQYVIGKTTHVVSSKRNTAKGLQALINAKFIVTNSFVDALVYATTPGDLDEPESASPLEQDFELNWPDPKQHLPAKGNEPNERPAEFFAPNPLRSNVFEGYTFVFCDQTQFESLQSPINNGGGKAVQFVLEPGKTSAEELVRYVKSVAGEKGMGEFEDGSEGKGVVVVKFRGKREFQDWAAELCVQVALALDQRLIEQNEFLDAILTNDASMLRRPLLEEDEEGSNTVYGAVQSPNAAAAEDPAQTEFLQPPPRRMRPTGTKVSRFKGFDDGFDDSPLTTHSYHTETISQINNGLSGGKSQLNSNALSFENSTMEGVSQVSRIGDTQSIIPTKRAAPVDEENEDELADQLFPAAAAMKRRRIEEQEEAERTGIPTQTSFGKSLKEPAPEIIRKATKEVNIKQVVRERREAEENAARQEEESLKETFEDANVDGLKNLAVVEDMELPERSTRPRRDETTGGTGSRWDERWNGRKNFKKFHRRGEGAQARRGQSVIVPLEEVRKKDFGIGEEYWVEGEKSKRKRKAKEGVSQSQSQAFNRGRSPSEEQSIDVDDEVTAAIINATSRKLPDLTEQVDESMNTIQVENRKRPAPTRPSGAAAKKQKTIAVKDSDSDSEDDLKFRFKKRI